jgi:hypothetical protein
MGNQQPLKLSEYKNVLLTDEKTVSCILGVLRTKKEGSSLHMCVTIQHSISRSSLIFGLWKYII